MSNINQPNNINNIEDMSNAEAQRRDTL